MKCRTALYAVFLQAINRLKMSGWMNPPDPGNPETARRA